MKWLYRVHSERVRGVQTKWHILHRYTVVQNIMDVQIFMIFKLFNSNSIKPRSLLILKLAWLIFKSDEVWLMQIFDEIYSPIHMKRDDFRFFARDFTWWFHSHFGYQVTWDNRPVKSSVDDKKFWKFPEEVELDETDLCLSWISIFKSSWLLISSSSSSSIVLRLLFWYSPLL